MNVFHFKCFDVLNEESSMKVNTDGVLLGAAVTLKDDDRTVLDAGTGTGTIALMLAQRYSALPQGLKHGLPQPLPQITGIDIDAPSAAEAGLNFAASRWHTALRAGHCPLRDYFPPQRLDLIVSNPPYYDESLLPPVERRSMARHTAGPALSFASLVDYARDQLAPGGRLAVILPSDQERRSIRYAVACGLYPFRILRIRSTPVKPVSRVIMEFCTDQSDAVKEELLTIQDPSSYPENRNGYTPEYLSLTGEFYIK